MKDLVAEWEARRKARGKELEALERLEPTAASAEVQARLRRRLDRLRERAGAQATEVLSQAPDPLDAWLEAVGIPLRLRQVTAASWDERINPRPAAVEIGGPSEWLGDPWCLLLHGPPGVGKSLAAAIIVHQAARSTAWRERLPARHPTTDLPTGVAWLHVGEVVRDLHRSRERRIQGLEPLRRRGMDLEAWIGEVMSRYQLVVLDDVGSESPSPLVGEVVDGWIQALESRTIPTIITMNDADTYFARRGRADSRLHGGRPVALGGRDAREALGGAHDE